MANGIYSMKAKILFRGAAFTLIAALLLFWFKSAPTQMMRMRMFCFFRMLCCLFLTAMIVLARNMDAKS